MYTKRLNKLYLSHPLSFSLSLSPSLFLPLSLFLSLSLALSFSLSMSLLSLPLSHLDLAANGRVWTFGESLHGELGTGVMQVCVSE